jgi:hypothetical protein
MESRFSPLIGLSTLSLLAVAAGAAWAADGVPVCEASMAQSAPAVAISPAGGAWVTWLDRRNGYSTDVYGCRLDSAGTPSTGGASQGSPLTWVTCTKSDLTLVPDGAAGALATWADDRCDQGTGQDIFVLRIGADGLPVAGWPKNGAAVTRAMGDQLRPALAPDGFGGAFLAWVDRSAPQARLFAHHVLSTGALDPLWPANGLIVASAVTDSLVPVVAPDGEGGLYLAWDDTRFLVSDIRAQRLTASGEPSPGWPEDGVGVCTFIGFQFHASLQASPAGILVSWLDRRIARQQVYASRLLPDGERAPGWNTDGNRLAPTNTDQAAAVVTAVGEETWLVAWQEARPGGSGLDVYAQRFDSTGAIAEEWPASGAEVCDEQGDQSSPVVTPDGAGGVFVGWRDGRNEPLTGGDLYVQRLDAEGHRATDWPGDGAPLSAAPAEQRDLRLLADGRGGAYAVWTDGRNDATTGDDIATRFVRPGGPVADHVQAIAASHRDGQTFVRWSALPGKGWKYRVYSSPAPILSAADLAGAALEATLGDSTACDARLSRVMGQVYGYRIDPGGPELDPGSGLFVRTVPASGTSYYAVTSQAGSFGEDAFVTAGENSLSQAVEETLAVPRPVYQRSLAVVPQPLEVWTMWASPVATALMPAMANVPGMAFDLGLIRGTEAAAPLVVHFHHWGGSLLDGAGGIGVSGEWVLALDDQLPNGEATFWYGYHQNYDVHSREGVPPTSGDVIAYTARRVDWTLDWALKEFPIDTTRVFAYGYSMGAIGSSELAFRRPGRLAGAMCVIGHFDFSYVTDPDPESGFNPGGTWRSLTDRMWGPVTANLPSDEGAPAFEQLNATLIASSSAAHDLPPMLIFNGRKDLSMGWSEKVPFWSAMQAHHRGSYFFWDNRDHSAVGAVWGPMQTPLYLDRFRTDRSFPALSNCSADGVLGDGSPASGDSIGTLNGFVEWDPNLLDQTDGWSVTLRLRSLARTTGMVAPPESATVDLTPRRVQHFLPAPFATVPYRVVRLSDESVLRRGDVQADSLSVVTLEAVPIPLTGCRVEIGVPALAGVTPRPSPPALRLSCVSPSPAGRLRPTVQWPAAVESRLDLVDVSGRRVLTLFQGVPPGGEARYDAGPATLAPGLYFLSARSGSQVQSRRVVLLR